MLLRFVEDVVFARPGTTVCTAGIEVGNERSVRAFAKAGFTPVRDDREDGRPRRLVRRDRTA